ncbi:NAD(P)/FAD-dependent oxidoreductase [Edaphobacter dinghuensis]|uniref:D-amino acid oxidase n=1 Tax=Edaphobacter dinghuensis TaxID=1560005 RepID=A0A917H7N6_9BACT|nr:FAD-dependent oxidoreductase [Edaphobacter dinghuensis]GGG69716.1 D-amino acid oxidase [Edaphobacter dinghuensis]
MNSFDVLILGAGIIGCACARECAQAGLKVGIVEVNIPGGGATAAGMGHLVVMDDSPAQLALTRYSRSLWQELMTQLPPTVEYENRGTIWVAADEEEMAEVHAKQNIYASAGVDSIVLDSAAIASEEPELRAGLAGGLLVPDDAVIYPPTAAAYFLAEAMQHGALLLRGHAAVKTGTGVVTLDDGSTLTSGRIILATGADKTILPWLPLQKRKGHLAITDRYPNFLRHQLVELGYLKSAHKITEDSVAFNIQPRTTGQLLIGSSRQYGNEYAAADNAILREMLNRACNYMPALAHLSAIRVWTGFRVATPDKLPYIGPTEDPTLFLAMGFEGLGITNAPGAARLLADEFLNRQSEIDPTPYLPSRVARMEVAHG